MHANPFATEPQAVAQVRAFAAAQGLPAIHIAADEGRFLMLLVRLLRAQRVLELGTLGGYSAAWMALGLAPGGRVHTVEGEPRHATLARQALQAARLHDRVTVHQGTAQTLLPSLAQLAPWDLVFIDADKQGYPAYWAWAVEHVRPGGIIAAHNATWPVVRQNLWPQVQADPRVQAHLYPSPEGLLWAVRVG